MENAVDALKIAFAVFVFTMALSLAMYMFSEAKATGDIVLARSDVTGYMDYTELEDIQEGVTVIGTDRVVGLETIIPTLYKYYKELINRCKIDIFASGTIENLDIYKIIEENEQIAKLKERTPEYIVNKQKAEKINEKEERIVEEHLNVGQGNLVLGLKVNDDKENGKYIASVYNAILGGGANSKLFQNVREKESLAYTAGSNYKRQKDAIFIRCGIEIDKYEKALNTIKVQLADMKEGKFSEEDINNAKQLINSSIKSINSEQDTEITYYYGQELSEQFVSIEEYMKKIEEVSKNDIEHLANSTFIDTIYFLRN